MPGRHAGAPKMSWYVAARVHEPVREEHAEEWHEERAEQEQEALIGAQLDRQRAERADRGRERDEQADRQLWEEVLQRDRRRVGVREGVVGLGDREGRGARATRLRPPAAAGGDLGRVGEVAGEKQDRAEGEQEDVRNHVPGTGSPQRGARST